MGVTVAFDKKNIKKGGDWSLEVNGQTPIVLSIALRGRNLFSKSNAKYAQMTRLFRANENAKDFKISAVSLLTISYV